MSWIRDLVLSLLITSVTGDILVLVWMSVVSVGREKLTVHYVYLMLRGVLAGYLFTLIYLILHRCTEYIRNDFDVLYGSTRFLDRLIFALFLIWVLGMGLQIISQINMWICFRQMKRSCVIAPGKYVSLLQKMCSEMKIRQPVCLCPGYGVKMPFISGVRKPKIFLPIKKFSMEELEMILYHELVHYKQGDTFWKPVFGLIGNIYWFSPLSKILWREAVRWTEANCDFYCCKEKFETKKYFMLLLDMGSARRLQANTYLPMWTEGSEELKWRINCMKKHRNQKTYIITAIVLVMASVFGCGISVYASTQGIKEIYQKIHFSTFEGTEEPMHIEELLEYHGNLEEFAEMEVVQHEEDGGEKLSNVTLIDNWKIANNSIHYSNGFKVQTGESIVVMVSVVPTDKTVKVGIKKPDGNTAYVINLSVGQAQVASYDFPFTPTFEGCGQYSSIAGTTGTGAYVSPSVSATETTYCVVSGKNSIVVASDYVKTGDVGRKEFTYKSGYGGEGHNYRLYGYPSSTRFSDYNVHGTWKP